MTHLEYIIGAIGLLFLVVFGTRAFPFVFGKYLKESPYLLFLGKQLPASIILLLATFYAISMAKPHYGQTLLCEFIAVIATLLVQWRFRNTVVSLIVGTAVYLCLHAIFC